MNERPAEDEVSAVLSRLAEEKHSVLARGEDGRSRKYSLMPFVPGTFELVMMEGKDDNWHRRFGRLFEAVYDTGYIKNILKTDVWGQVSSNIGDCQRQSGYTIQRPFERNDKCQ